MDARWISPSGIEACQWADVPSLLERDDGFVWVDVPSCDEAKAQLKSEPTAAAPAEAEGGEEPPASEAE